jgi:hypothetical protein
MNDDELRDELAEMSPDFRRVLREYLFADPRDRAAILQSLREESGELAYVWAVGFGAVEGDADLRRALIRILGDLEASIPPRPNSE